MADKTRSLASMTTRQKLTIVVFVLIVVGLAWQLKGMFSSGDLGSSIKSTPTSKTAGAKTPEELANMPPPRPKQVEVPQPQPLTAREAALIQLQQDTQDQYLRALNELQLLRVARDIATTTKDISKAKLDQVTAEKKIVDMLTEPSQSKNLVTSSIGLLDEVKYSVVSVSQIQYRWSAVMSYKGNLFNVHSGDILPPDGSKVVSIQKSGVTIQKDGETKKISLVSGF
jgi:type IV pilus biogenesis protein PilP